MPRSKETVIIVSANHDLSQGVVQRVQLKGKQAVRYYSLSDALKAADIAASNEILFGLDETDQALRSLVFDARTATLEECRQAAESLSALSEKFADRVRVAAITSNIQHSAEFTTKKLDVIEPLKLSSKDLLKSIVDFAVGTQKERVFR